MQTGRWIAESVKEYGVLVPALVRPKPEGGYEMVAEHRRKMANQMAKRQTIPCIVRSLTDDEATLIMVDSNLQRETILPSEKAFAYKMKLEAMNRQGKRTVKMRKFSEEGRLNQDVIFSIMAEEKGNQKEQFRMPRERISRYFSAGTPVKQIEDSFLRFPFPHPTPSGLPAVYQPKKKYPDCGYPQICHIFPFVV